MGSNNSSSDWDSDGGDDGDSHFMPTTTQAWPKNTYEIEDDEDDDDDDKKNDTEKKHGTRHRSRRKGAMSMRDRRTHSVLFLIEKVLLSLGDQCGWSQLKSDFDHVQKCVDQLTAATAASTTEQPLIVNNGICRARWKTGGRFYSCSDWTLHEDTMTFNVTFQDDGSKRSLPCDEIQLPRTKAPVQFWELCHRLAAATLLSTQTTSSSSSSSSSSSESKKNKKNKKSNAKLSTKNSKALTRLKLTIQKLITESDYLAWYASTVTGASCLPLLTEMLAEDAKVVDTTFIEKKRKKKKRSKKKESKKKRSTTKSNEIEKKHGSDEGLQFFGSEMLALELEESMQIEKGRMFLRVQQRTSRKNFTIVWGFPIEIDLKLVCKEMATRFQCGGSIVEKPAQRKGVDVKINTVQLQGDHRNGVIDFLFEQAFISSRDQVTTIGF